MINKFSFMLLKFQQSHSAGDCKGDQCSPWVGSLPSSDLEQIKCTFHEWSNIASYSIRSISSELHICKQAL